MLRTPEEEREINADDLKMNVKRILDELYNLNNKGKIKLSPNLITKEIHEIIDRGVDQMSIYHANIPLMKMKNGNYTSEDLKLLYYYHNRLEGYGLHKYIG